MKQESKLKSQFTEELKRQLPLFIMQYFLSSGSPDRSITGAGYTTHWEFKHGTPDFESKGDQELMCARLAIQGHCRYVVWQENAHGFGQRTMILRPLQVIERVGWNFTPEAWCVGFDHKWLVEQVRKAHRL